MRSHRVVLFLLLLALPVRLQAQAATPGIGTVAPPDVEHQGKWACGTQAPQDPDLAMLWRQAGVAFRLVHASLSSGHNQYFTETSTVEGTRGYFPPRAYWGSQPGAEIQHAVLTSWPVPGPPAAVLRASGFFAWDSLSPPTIYGPDPAFFLSDDFFGRFCFRAVYSDLTPVLPWSWPAVPDGWTGLEYRPDGSTPHTTIRGVLWFDPADASLRVIEWRYVGMPDWARGSASGGRIDVTRLADGSWFPRHWIMMAPVPMAVPLTYGEVPKAGWTFGGGRWTEGAVTLVRDAAGATLIEYPRYPRGWEH